MIEIALACLRRKLPFKDLRSSEPEGIGGYSTDQSQSILSFQIYCHFQSKQRRSKTALKQNIVKRSTVQVCWWMHLFSMFGQQETSSSTVCQCSTVRQLGKPHIVSVLHQALQLFAKEQTVVPKSCQYFVHNQIHVFQLSLIFTPISICSPARIK